MTINSTKLTLAVAALAFGVAGIAAAADPLPPASTKSGLTYATDMKPIFDASGENFG